MINRCLILAEADELNGQTNTPTVAGRVILKYTVNYLNCSPL